MARNSEESEKKYAWFQIAELIFTAPHYLTEYMNSMLGPDPDRTYSWINNSSPHLYATRWRPDFCFVYIPESDADTFDANLRHDRIGHLQITPKGEFQRFSKQHVEKLNSSPYNHDLIGKNVKIIKGPLDEFYGKVVAYSEELKKYIISVRLLVTEVQYPHHLNEFQLIEDSDETDNVNSLLKQLREEIKAQ